MKKNKVTHPVKPFWSWNDRLDITELKSQIDSMKAAGIDGFFMHARGGLETPYLKDEWFNCIEACIDYAKELDMEAWAYDENGWPSGFGDGEVPRKGEAYQQKWLCLKSVDEGEELPQNLLGIYSVIGDEIKLLSAPKKGAVAVYYDINKYYVDVFNEECIAYFIETTHKKYADRFGDKIGSYLNGFFTDENQYSGKSAPWSPVFIDAFKKRYGYDLIPYLPLLFMEKNGAKSFRSDYYNLVADLFKKSFLKQLYDWCEKHGCRLTGHVMGEQHLSAQAAFTGGAMSCYEYFQEPGMDWLGRRICIPLLPKQLGSVAKQLGKKALTETFAMCGWDVSLNELKGIAESQYVYGVTDLCTHLSAYSLRGNRKRDYPPSLFVQSPWFATAYKTYCDYFVKLGELLYEGTEIAPLLMLHPMETVFLLRNIADETPMRNYDAEFLKLTEEMAGNHILHHYGDEALMARYGSVEGNSLRVGKCSYKAVLLPRALGITDSTLKLLLSFGKNGGKIYCLGDAPGYINGREDERCKELKNYLIFIDSVRDLEAEGVGLKEEKIVTSGKENNNIAYTSRIMPDGQMLYYLVNTSNCKQTVEFTVGDDRPLAAYDILKNELTPVNRKNNTLYLTLGEYGSVILKTLDKPMPYKEVKTEKINLNSSFKITKSSPNAITLDKCRYRIDGGEWQAEKAVIQLQNILLNLRRPLKFELEFSFDLRDIAAAKNLKLCIETPEKYSFKINSKDFAFKTEGHFVDKAIKTADISNLVKTGENTITVCGEFYQRDEVYRVLLEPNIHESEINKLTLDTELESIYLIGDFSVINDGELSFGDKKTIFAGKQFYLDKARSEVNISKITESGYLFFSGELELSQKIHLKPKADTRYILSLSRLNAPAAKLLVNGREVKILAFAPFEVDVTDYLCSDENEIAILLYSGNRNLLGPHHRPYGESYTVGPNTFTDTNNWPENSHIPAWTENYSFLKFGVEL